MSPAAVLEHLSGRESSVGRKKPEKAIPEKPKTQKRTGVSLHVYLDPKVRKAIEDCSNANRRSLTEEVSIAIEEHCRKHNLWPPESNK